jgi:hypothetical protein
LCAALAAQPKDERKNLKLADREEQKITGFSDGDQKYRDVVFEIIILSYYLPKSIFFSEYI